MKWTKTILCGLLSALLTVPSFGALPVGAKAAYDFKEHTDKAFTVTDGVNYREYEIISGTEVYDKEGKLIENQYVSASSLEFGMEDYMFVPYTATAGGAATLDKQYAAAVADGYDVVGIVNGSFFSTDPGTAHGNYGYMNDYIVSNGVIYSADNGEKKNMLCVDGEGRLTTVASSRLCYTLYFNGELSSAPVACVNKSGGFKGADNWGNSVYYFDSHAGNLMSPYRADPEMDAQALTYECCPGYEVLCRKLNGTDLTIGGTLEAEVISVKENAYGGKIADDEFILFLKATSTQTASFKKLKAGDKVSLMVSEGVAESAPITSKALSITSNIGYLVKDGVDVAATSDFNAGAPHSNTTRARWTAIGVKADGSYMLFTTEGLSTGDPVNVTLQDVSKAMLSLGCVDVVRFDGGGSTAMYVCDTGDGTPGYLQGSTRPISDCLLVVRRSSAALQVSDEQKAALDALLAQAEAKQNDSAVKELAEYATAIRNNERSAHGDYLLVTAQLKYALSGKSELGDLITLAGSVQFTDYSEYVLGNMRQAYAAAVATLGDGSATADDVKAAYDELNKWYEMTGSVTVDGTEYPTVTDGIYLTGMNLYIYEDYSTIYTAGTDVSGVNLNWSRILSLRYDESIGAYTVVDNWQGSGNAEVIVKRLGFSVVPDDCLVIGVHGDFGAGSRNKAKASRAKKGQMLVLYGIDVESASASIGAYFLFADYVPPYTPGDLNENGKLDAQDYLLLKRYYLETLSFELSETQLLAADANGDGSVTAIDYFLVKKAYLNDMTVEEALKA